MVLVLLVVFAFAGFGQVFGGGARTYGSPHGFGNVLFPGMGSAPPIKFGANPYGPHASFPQRLSATIRGNPGYPGYGRGHGGGVGYVPIAYPVYVGGGYGDAWNAPVPPQYVAPPPAATPQVIINQYFTPDTARPVMREYSPSELPASAPSGMRTFEAPPAGASAAPGTERSKTSVHDEKPTIYLVALNDGTIQAAVAYWVETGILNYVTVQGSHNRASLDVVDRDMSERLNRERNVEFILTDSKRIR
jgi:hypothetical protein